MEKMNSLGIMTQLGFEHANQHYEHKPKYVLEKSKILIEIMKFEQIVQSRRSYLVFVNKMKICQIVDVVVLEDDTVKEGKKGKLEKIFF